MNSFDLLIERYKKELIDAKRRSIEKEITVLSAEPEIEAEAEPVVSEGEEEQEAAFVFAHDGIGGFLAIGAEHPADALLPCQATAADG